MRLGEDNHLYIARIQIEELENRKCSAYPACQPEVESAGGIYINLEMDAAVTDNNLVTSPAWPSHPAMLKQFNALLP